PADDEEVVEDEAEPAEVDGGAGGEDSEAPTLVATTPESDSPQRSDVTVSFQFSEPMDQASVEDAYSSLSFPKESISFAWNEAGDTVTLIPIEPFAYADGNAGGAYGYGFSILETATDLAGNPLGQAATVSFSTFRRFVLEAELQGNLTGWVSTGGGSGLDHIYVGDTAINDNTLYGFVGFSLAGFPVEYEEIEIADLLFEQTAVNAGVAALGQLYANQTFHDDVSGFALSADMMASAPISDVGFNEVIGDYRKASLIDIVIDDLANREARTDLNRYRLMFTVATDEDGKQDRVDFSEAPTLTITYLAE
ncbi:MAG TPA: Ig-like domain-containing protein, partial [Polyangiaceae bacterium]|nr:Ig-like domain-containing protein [Polyangiaceae bacterium]